MTPPERKWSTYSSRRRVHLSKRREALGSLADELEPYRLRQCTRLLPIAVVGTRLLGSIQHAVGSELGEHGSPGEPDFSSSRFGVQYV